MNVLLSSEVTMTLIWSDDNYSKIDQPFHSHKFKTYILPTY